MAKDREGWTEDGSVDWDEVNTDAPTALEPGVYLGKIVKATAQATKEKKLPSVNIQFEVTERFNDDIELKRTMFDTMVLTQEAAFRCKNLCEVLDIDPPERTGYSVVREWAADLVGSKVWMKLKLNTYNGTTNNKVDRYLSDDEIEEVAEAVGGVESKSSKSSKSRKGKTSDPAGGRSSRRREEPEDISKEEEEEPKRASNGRAAKAPDEDEEETPRRRRRRVEDRA